MTLRTTLLTTTAALLAVLAAWVVLRPTTPRTPPSPSPTRGNILLVILDDVGVDRIGLYDVSERVPPTPVLDRLAAEGLTFANAYSNPSCTPTRAGILTGLHAMNHGIGNPLAPHQHGLPFDNDTLPEVLDALTGETYAHAAIGKWHLTTVEEGLDGPARTGFGHFAGNLANLSARRGETYTDWMRVEDGAQAQTTTYNTTDIVDSAARFIERTGDQPWFVWLAFNAAHVPFHHPPDALVPPRLRDSRANPDLFDAMVAAADHELGRLLDGLPAPVRARTTVIVIGDNGTAREAVRPPTPENRAKFSLYEGGVHVPLVIAGPSVVDPGRTVNPAVSHVDLFPTILELAGAPVDDALQARIDGVSMMPYLRDPDAAPIRTEVYAEEFSPNGFDLTRRRKWVRMLRERGWKLLVRMDGETGLFRVRKGQDGTNVLVDGEPPDEESRDVLARLRRRLEDAYQPRWGPEDKEDAEDF